MDEREGRDAASEEEEWSVTKEEEDASERTSEGTLGPSGTAIDKMQKEGAIEPDPPEDLE